MNLILKILPLAALLLASCVSEKPAGENHLPLGTPLPEFTVSGPSGTIKSSTEYFSEKRTLIVYFRTTCPDCTREMPKVQAAWDEFGEDADFRLAAISRESEKIVADYWAKSGFSMPYYIDTDGSVLNKLAIRYVPTLYLFDTYGKVAYAAVEDAKGLTELIEGLK